MAANLTAQEGMNVVQSTFTQTNIFGADWLIPVAIIVLTMLLITRDVNKFPIILAPVSAGWWAIGLRGTMATLLIAVGMITMIIWSLSLNKHTIARVIKGKERIEIEGAVEKARRATLRKGAIAGVKAKMGTLGENVITKQQLKEIIGSKSQTNIGKIGSVTEDLKRKLRKGFRRI